MNSTSITDAEGLEAMMVSRSGWPHDREAALSANMAASKVRRGPH